MGARNPRRATLLLDGDQERWRLFPWISVDVDCYEVGPVTLTGSGEGGFQGAEGEVRPQGGSLQPDDPLETSCSTTSGAAMMARMRGKTTRMPTPPPAAQAASLLRRG